MPDPYETAFRASLDDPDGFWGKAAAMLRWEKPWDVVLDRSNPPFFRWFSGGRVNTCFNAVDRHADGGRGDQAALIYDSPVTDTVLTVTYRELKNETAHLAGALAALGVSKGDRVILYMPMVPEAVFAMLACARLGAVHSVVFGGFAASELAMRIDDARPVAILSASCGIDGKKVVPYKALLDQAIDLARHKPRHTLILARPQAEAPLTPGRDVDWREAVARARPHDCVPVAATDPLYILYTSGTTGQPKGIVRDNGGHMVAMTWSMKHVYGASPGDVFWAASDIGWAVGHSYIVYGPLLSGCTSILYEGKPVGTPDAAAFWRVIAQHKVQTLFTAPTSLRAIKREDPNATLVPAHDIGSLRALFLAGERSDPDTLRWAETALEVPVIDNWWQTETGWPIVSNCLGLHLHPVKHGSCAKPVPGWDVDVLDEAHQPCAPEQVGALVIKLPLPPGSLPTLWNADPRFLECYLEEFPGYYKTADAGYIDEDGYVFIMSRTDDIINVAGHRLCTGGMEEVLASHPDVAECAVIGIHDEIKGQRPLGFLLLKAGVTRPHETIVAEVVALVRERIGPVAAFKLAIVVDRLPKTRSGKILRGTMQKIADDLPYRVPATIDDPAVLDEIERALTLLGLSKARPCGGTRV